MNNIKRINIIPYFSGLLLMLAYICNISYIARIVGFLGTIQMSIYLFALLLIVPNIIVRKHHVNREFRIVVLFIVYLSMLTVVQKGNIRATITTIVPIIAFSLFILSVNYNELMDVMRIWAIAFTLLVVIDYVTILLYPNGLYTTAHVRSIYEANWFLGYKTARINYSLPALLFISMLSVSRKGKLGKLFFCVSALVIADTYFSFGVTALIGVIIFVVGAYFISIYYSNNSVPRIFSLLSDRNIFFFAILLFWIMTVVFQDNEYFFNTIASALDKSSTLSGRTYIWTQCINAVRESNWMGIGIVDTSTMEMVTGGMVNAHSQLLTILLQGGIPAVVMYFILAMAPMRILRKVAIDYVMQLCVYVYFIIGLVSSTLTYSPFLFMLLVLIDRRREDVLCAARYYQN